MPEPDYSKMSTEELRAAAMQWAEGGTEAKVDEQPRNDKGQFVAKAEPSDAPVAEPEEEVVYERTIDLGDGAGVQVFQGKTLEELVDKLATAQENASRKIREQQAQLREKPKPAPTLEDLPTLTPEQEFMLQQEMLTNPSKALQRVVGAEIERREKAAAAEFTKQKEASEAFVANTPDYYKSEKNGQKLLKYLETFNKEVSEENLKEAFKELNSSGLLESKPQNKETPAATAEEETTEARIEPKAPTSNVVRRRVVGGVSVKRSAPAPVQTTELTEEQLRKMPLQELEALTRRQLMQGL